MLSFFWISNTLYFGPSSWSWMLIVTVGSGVLVGSWASALRGWVMKQERVLRAVETAWKKKKVSHRNGILCIPVHSKRERHGSSPCLLGSMGDLSHQHSSVGDKRNGRACHGSTQGSLVPAQIRCQNPLAYMLRLSRDMNA
ncbi:hypothetical protein J3F84DRAFT_318823 [Trichoderma pleuroticola]